MSNDDLSTRTPSPRPKSSPKSPQNCCLRSCVRGATEAPRVSGVWGFGAPAWAEGVGVLERFSSLNYPSMTWRSSLQPASDPLMNRSGLGRPGRWQTFPLPSKRLRFATLKPKPSAPVGGKALSAVTFGPRSTAQRGPRGLNSYIPILFWGPHSNHSGPYARPQSPIYSGEEYCGIMERLWEACLCQEQAGQTGRTDLGCPECSH